MKMNTIHWLLSAFTIDSKTVRLFGIDTNTNQWAYLAVIIPENFIESNSPVTLEALASWVYNERARYLREAIVRGDNAYMKDFLEQITFFSTSETVLKFVQVASLVIDHLSN